MFTKVKLFRSPHL
jgi:glutamate decarboxylase